MPEIRIVIPQDGNGIFIDHIGFEGPACFEAAEQYKRFMASMGVTFQGEEITPKPEAFATGEVTTQETQAEKASE